MNRIFKITVLLALVLASFDTEAQRGKKRKHDPERAQQTKSEFLKVDRSLSDFFNSAYGYAIFPSIGKGAIGIGGAAGKGVVYQSNRVVGGVNMTQVSLGFQFGGQAYSEVIFFEDVAAFRRFQQKRIAIRCSSISGCPEERYFC